MADKNKIEEPVKAPDMADLLEYFETRSRALDKEGQPMLDPSTLQFMSLIKFNGVSILPPVLNEGRREEMLSYKHEALRREKTSRVKKTEELHAKVQSIVAGVEERRAAKQASKSLKTSVSSSRKSSSDRPATAETVSKVTTKSTSKSGVSVPSEIAISVTGSSKDVTSSPSRNSSKASPKSISSGSTKSSVSPSRSASHSSSDSKKKDHTNYKSLSKLGALSKQKSFSSQHLDKSGIQPDSSVSMSKNTLLPHPPVGRPPSRGSMRQSSSTPDLRTIDMAVKTEELKKPIKSGRSLSPKGGRPQASEPENVKEPKERPESRTGKPRDKETIKQNKMRENKTKQEIVNKAREDLREQKSRKNETSVKKGSDVRTSGSKSVNKAESDGSMVSRRKPVDQPNTQIHNPLEVLEQELTREDEHERKKRFSGSSQGSTGEVRPKVFEEVRQELDPIQTATAELFPFPISEEQAMATLDSLQPDFASLEQQDSLPKDYNGIPLTSLKQQQIIHMLTKLSKALNMEDTLSSTTSTAMPGEHVKQEYLRGPTSRSEGDYRNIQYGASGGKGSMYGEYAEGNDLADELSVNITADSATTGSSYQNSSNTSAHSRARMSPTGSSILSSASSVSGSRQRMSPKSLKNTVHFSTLVTEISTSASQSYEDKISYRKLDITPKNSENFEDQLDVSNQSRNLGGEEVTPVSSYSVSASGSNLLSKVALSPSVDTSAGSPGEFSNHNPFDNSNQESDLNTSDKENEYVPVDHDSSDENFDMNVRSGRNQPVLNVYMANMPAGPIGENHPAVVHVKSKSEMSDSSVLKESSEKVLQENVSRTNLKLDPQSYYGSDLDNLIQGKITPSDSITSMQEEITRSYMLAQNKSEKESNDSEDKFEFKKPKKVVRKQLDVDDSLVILQPVIYTNTGSSLQENRSMLEEEEIIRNNLERVHLEDSESDEDNIEHPIQMADESDNEFDTRSENVNEECIVENEGSNEENNEDEDESDEGSELESDVDEEVSDDDVNDAQPLKVVEEDTDDVKVQEVDDQSNTNQEVEKEEEAKAEHIQRYLNQVHEQSLHHDDNESVHSDDAEPTKSQSFVDVMDNIGALISSFTTNIQTMNHMSQEELFKMQTQQFELIQQKLIEHQRAQLEELFVAQRREQMSLEKEIEEYHKKIVDVESPALSEINMEPVLHRQTDIPATGPMVPGFNSVMNPSPMCSTMNGPINNALPGPVNPLKPRISNSMPQVTQAWQAYPQPIHSSAKSPPFVVQPVASAVPIQNPNMSFNTSYSSMGPYQDPRLNMAMGMDPRSGVGVNYPMGYVPDPNISSISHNTSYSTIPHRDPGMLRGNMNPPPNLDVIRSQDPGSSHASNPFIYPSSPSLYIDPKDRDNASEVSGFAKATPKQLMFSNQSTPVQTVKQHKSYKPLQHSPVKPTSTQRETGQYVIPEKVFDPSMHHKFSKVTAAVRGYLTRRLLQTPKVQEIIKTINDTRNFAFSFQAETPIKKGTYSREDRTLLERIVNQLQAALLDIHEIFFIIPTSERMSIIASARHLQEEKMLRESQRRSMDSVSRSQPKLSKATLKAMERKKKAQLAEESVFGSTELRPKSAPPSTSSPLPSTDISGPLRRHYHSLFVRALRPLQGQISPIVTDRQITVREMKERPKTAPEKRKSGEGSNKTKKSSNSKSSKTSTNSASVKQKSSKEKSQNSVAAKDKTQGTNVASRTKKMDKAWR